MEPFLSEEKENARPLACPPQVRPRRPRAARPLANYAYYPRTMVKHGSRSMLQAKQRLAPANKITGAIAKIKVRPRSEVRKEGAEKGDLKTRAKKSIAQMGPNHTAHSKFNTLHLKKRRSNRPIKPKQSRSARLQTEEAAAEAEKERQRGADLAQKRRLLTKLHSRQMAAGKTEAAAQTQEQINSLGM